MRTSSETTVVIVGAGPSGLMAAIILAMHGVPFRIVDKKSGPVEETRALVVHAKTLELWDKLGLADYAVSNGSKMGAVQVLRTGQPVGRLTFADTGADKRTPFPFVLSFTQDQSEHMMVARLAELSHAVEWNTSVLGLTQTASEVHVQIEHPDGTDETIAARWAVGADGARSPVRHALNLQLEGETYEQTLFLADVELDWPLEAGRLVIDLTTQGFMAYFPIPGANRYRVVGALLPELANKTVLTVEDIQQQINTTSDLAVTLRDPRWVSVYRIHHRMSERFRIGRVFLVGDAAHIHSPAGGQGMNTGIGDAFNLVWKLALVANDMAYETLLDSYEPERMPFARAILNGTDRGFSMGVTSKPVGRLIRQRILPLLIRGAFSIPAMQRRGYWFISQLWTTYQDSPIVATSTPSKRGPQPGDRAPDGRFQDRTHNGTTLFSELRGIEHHLLLFEGTKPSAGTRSTMDKVDQVVHGYAAPIVVHTISSMNRQLHRQYAATSARMFLVRPDGHIAYCGDGDDARGLERYLAQHFIPHQSGSAAALPQNAVLEANDAVRIGV